VRRGQRPCGAGTAQAGGAAPAGSREGSDTGWWPSSGPQPAEIATVVYYRRRVFSGARDFLALGLFPLGAAAFLAWMFAKSVQAAPSPQIWSLVAIIGLGMILMLCARFVLRSTFFQIRRESDA
jgi:hypothetical protein